MKVLPLIGEVALKNCIALTPRDYQVKIATSALVKKNTLVILPTGMGKTLIAILVIARLLQLNSNSKILILAPTKPLASQLYYNLVEYLEIPTEKITILTGDVSPEKRLPAYLFASVICATPQTIESDVLSSKCDLNDFSLVVFDEAHRVVGEYAYAFIAKNVKCKMLGLSASPSSEVEKINEICANLKIENIETLPSSEVAKFKKNVKLEWLYVDLPSWMPEIKKTFLELISENAKLLKNLNYLESADLTKISKTTLLQSRSRIAQNLKFDKSAYTAMSIQAKLMNLLHAHDLLESQGLIPLRKFLHSLKQGNKSKAAITLASDFRIQKTTLQCEKLISEGENHPKEKRAVQVLQHELKQESTAIIFAHFKSTVERLTKILNENNISAQALTGKGAGGMTRKKQDEIVKSFKNNEFKTLVCTSVGEEGLDLTRVDLVIFYEPVPSEIRLIQRRGRAGRAREGKVIVLIARGTKDEAMFWSSRRKEKEMQENIRELQKKYSKKIENQEHEKEKKYENKESKEDIRIKPSPQQKKITWFLK